MKGGAGGSSRGRLGTPHHHTRRQRLAHAGGASHLLDVFPHLQTVIADHQQLQSVIHKSILRGQGEI